MYIDRQQIIPYPFNGTFYEIETVKPDDGDLLGDGNDGSSDGDLLGDDDEDTATSSDAETTTDTEGETETSDEETVLLETTCDIQQAAKLINSGTIMADFKVYFPCEQGAKLPIRFNTKFRCDDYAIPIRGYVVGLEYSQLGGCSVDIKMNEV